MDVEVDEEGCSETCEFEVGDYLRGVDRAELVDGFELNEDLVFYNEICAEAAIEGEVFVADGDFFLRGD